MRQRLITGLFWVAAISAVYLAAAAYMIHPVRKQ